MERALYAANNSLSQFSELDENLKVFFSELDAVKGVADTNSIFENDFRNFISEKKLVDVYDKFEERLQQFRILTDSFGGKQERARAFLERFRNRATFAFSSQKMALEFIEQSISLHPDKIVCFKPGIIGTVDVDKLVADLKFERDKSQAICVPMPNLKSFVNTLIERNLAKDFVMRTSKLTFQLDREGQCSVSAEPAILRRVERIYADMKAKEGSDSRQDPQQKLMV